MFECTDTVIFHFEEKHKHSIFVEGNTETHNQMGLKYNCFHYVRERERKKCFETASTEYKESEKFTFNCDLKL